MSRILILTCHPDDECLSFGGLMAKAKEQGDEVHIHAFCVGGPCSNVPTEIRIKEFYNAVQYFGAIATYDHRELDGRLETISSCEITGIIDSLIQEYKPDEVYCNAYSEHADHIHLYKAFLGAARLKTGYMPRLFAVGTYPYSDQLYTQPVGGKIFNPLTEEQFKMKCDGFSLHKSQFKPSPSPLGIEGLRNQAQYYGMMCGYQYAELYFQIRYIRS